MKSKKVSVILLIFILIMLKNDVFCQNKVDSLLMSINKKFKTSSSINSTRLCKDIIKEFEEDYVNISKLKYGKLLIEYVSIYKKNGIDSMWGKLRIDNYKSSYFIIYKDTIKIDKIIVQNLISLNEKQNKIPLTIIPSEFYDSGFLYQSVILGNSKYYIVDSGPFGYYIVIKMTGPKIQIYYIEHSYSQCFPFKDLLWGDINSDGNLDFYLFLPKKKITTDGLHGYLVPYSICNEKCSIINEEDCFEIHSLENKMDSFNRINSENINQ